ncbi:MAG: sensor histidine kinase [Methylococcaceae bacterium]|nr:sensor histidine kinase [Methylococcaceae bacterium]
MNSLKVRLNRGLTAILILLFASHWLAADFVIRTVAENQMFTRLEHDGDSLLATLSLADDGQMRFTTDHVGLVYEQLYSGHYFTLQSGTQVLRSRSMGNETLSAPPPSLGGIHRYHALGPQDQPLLVLTRVLNLQNQSLSLTVAEDLTAIGLEIAHIRLAYLALSVAFLLTAIALQAADVRRALRPLADIRDDLQRVGRGQKTRIDANAPQEAQPLVDEINRLLLLVERRLLQSRHAVGNLAHALKTPLSILFRAVTDPALNDHPDLSRRLSEQTSIIHQRIELELKRARLSGTAKPGAGFNPKLELTGLVRILSTMYESKRLSIDLIAPDAFTPYDREDMLELIGNLADNACKWASGRVAIEVEYRQEQISLSVADDGPGCPAEDLEHLTQRGLRLDETQPGHGLGLAIVRDIVAFYDGTITIDRSPTLGGLRVCLRL